MAEIARLTVEIKQGILLSYGGPIGRFIVALCIWSGAPAKWFWQVVVVRNG